MRLLALLLVACAGQEVSPTSTDELVNLANNAQKEADLALQDTTEDEVATAEDDQTVEAGAAAAEESQEEAKLTVDDEVVKVDDEVSEDEDAKVANDDDEFAPFAAEDGDVGDMEAAKEEQPEGEEEVKAEDDDDNQDGDVVQAEDAEADAVPEANKVEETALDDLDEDDEVKNDPFELMMAEVTAFGQPQCKAGDIHKAARRAQKLRRTMGTCSISFHLVQDVLLTPKRARNNAKVFKMQGNTIIGLIRARKASASRAATYERTKTRTAKNRMAYYQRRKAHWAKLANKENAIYKGFVRNLGKLVNRHAKDQKEFKTALEGIKQAQRRLTKARGDVNRADERNLAVRKKHHLRALYTRQINRLATRFRKVNDKKRRCTNKYHVSRRKLAARMNAKATLYRIYARRKHRATINYIQQRNEVTKAKARLTKYNICINRMPALTKRYQREINRLTAYYHNLGRNVKNIANRLKQFIGQNPMALQNGGGKHKLMMLLDTLNDTVAEVETVDAAEESDADAGQSDADSEDTDTDDSNDATEESDSDATEESDSDATEEAVVAATGDAEDQDEAVADADVTNEDAEEADATGDNDELLQIEQTQPVVATKKAIAHAIVAKKKAIVTANAKVNAATAKIRGQQTAMRNARRKLQNLRYSKAFSNDLKGANRELQQLLIRFRQVRGDRVRRCYLESVRKHAAKVRKQLMYNYRQLVALAKTNLYQKPSAFAALERRLRANGCPAQRGNGVAMRLKWRRLVRHTPLHRLRRRFWNRQYQCRKTIWNYKLAMIRDQKRTIDTQQRALRNLKAWCKKKTPSPKVATGKLCKASTVATKNKAKLDRLKAQYPRLVNKQRNAFRTMNRAKTVKANTQRLFNRYNRNLHNGLKEVTKKGHVGQYLKNPEFQAKKMQRLCWTPPRGGQKPVGMQFYATKKLKNCWPRGTGRVEAWIGRGLSQSQCAMKAWNMGGFAFLYDSGHNGRGGWYRACFAKFASKQCYDTPNYQKNWNIMRFKFTFKKISNQFCAAGQNRGGAYVVDNCWKACRSFAFFNFKRVQGKHGTCQCVKKFTGGKIGRAYGAADSGCFRVDGPLKLGKLLLQRGTNETESTDETEDAVNAEDTQDDADVPTTELADTNSTDSTEESEDPSLVDYQSIEEDDAEKEGEICEDDLEPPPTASSADPPTDDDA